MQSDYLVNYLPNGIRLIFLPSKKFKTISIGLFLHQELNRDLAAFNALLPAVLEQGSQAYPDYLTLQRELENLYGADLSADIIKSGEKHILAFVLETAHDRFLGENGDLLKRGLSVLSSVIGDPLVAGGAFRQDYVNQEKSQLVKDIRALINDKGAYAYERCLALMCAEERFGVYKLGQAADYDRIDPESLYSYYTKIIGSNLIDLYVIGDLEAEKVFADSAAAFSFSRNGTAAVLPETDINFQGGEVRFFEEEMAVNQAKLVLGYRTNTAFRDPLHCALLVYSGILGGFPHSKLFMQVREEAGLAYYIHSRLERHKGLIVIAAGIAPDDYDKVRDIIDRQLAAMVTGRITAAELDHTKRGLINQLLSRQDSPGQLISFHLDGSVGGRAYTINELIGGIEAAGREEIAAVAERIRLDTVYLLRPPKGGSPHEAR